jgi:hypothetical protein
MSCLTSLKKKCTPQNLSFTTNRNRVKRKISPKGKKKKRERRGETTAPSNDQSAT